MIKLKKVDGGFAGMGIFVSVRGRRVSCNCKEFRDYNDCAHAKVVVKFLQDNKGEKNA